MNDLADFLLERVTDGVALARQVQAQAVTDRIDPADPRLPQLTLAARVLAECDALRRAVALHPQIEHGCRGEREIWIGIRNVPQPEHYSVWACPTLRVLALPYADHPDFDPAWRP